MDPAAYRCRTCWPAIGHIGHRTRFRTIRTSCCGRGSTITTRKSPWSSTTCSAWPTVSRDAARIRCHCCWTVYSTPAQTLAWSYRAWWSTSTIRRRKSTTSSLVEALRVVPGTGWIRTCAPYR
uniref:(northern house mosquito) hypothetical protein n=1 Tax=Culex pipiens TaxID=7175 RepID=A0A8D8I6N2_CULPI